MSSLLDLERMAHISSSTFLFYAYTFDINVKIATHYLLGTFSVIDTYNKFEGFKKQDIS